MEGLKRLIGLPENVIAHSLVVVGHPAEQVRAEIVIERSEFTATVRHSEPGEQRPTFYEFFGGKSYYRGPTFDRILEKPGTYSVYYWDPYAHGGDYVAVLGYKESWGLIDILRALIRTPMIRRTWNSMTSTDES